MKRESKFASSFYSANKDQLINQIESSFLDVIGPGKLPTVTQKSTNKLRSIICPHAGYMYSGPIAAWAYLEASKRKFPQTIILIGPNHTGIGPSISIYPKGSWQTPLGLLEIDSNISKAIADFGFDLDVLAHENEHSIEVQLPFLQYIYSSSFKIVCISIKRQDQLTVLDLSKALADTLINQDFLIVASSDLTHYESQVSAFQKDNKIIETFKLGSISAIYKEAMENELSACGLGPICTAIDTCNKKGATSIELLKYETSAAKTHDTDAVVGYASLAIFKN